MNSISFTNYAQSTKNTNELQKKNRVSEENFTAIDKEKLQQDTSEITNKAKENVKENFVFKTLRNIGVEDPKKTLKSLGLSIITIIGVAILGNKLTKPASSLGNYIDDFLTNGKNPISKVRKTIINGFKNLKNKANIKQPTFVKEIKEALKNRIGAKWQIFRGFENGAKGLFANTIIEILEHANEKNNGQDLLNALKNLFQDTKNGTSFAEDFIAKLTDKTGKIDRIKLCDEFLSNVAKANNCELTSKDFQKILDRIDTGEFGESLHNVLMKSAEEEKGLGSLWTKLMGNWWPGNIINKIAKKTTGKEIKGFKGNLGDSLRKYGAIRGKTSKTLLGKTVQIIPPLVGDQISNFVNDKSGFGVFLCANLVSAYNNLQDAPKEKKVVTAANDVVTGSLSWLCSFPLMYSAIYIPVTLSQMNATSKTGKFIKTICKPMALGRFSNNKLIGAIGGVGRFMLGMFVISPFIGKLIEKGTAKVLGKPYNKVEEEKQKQIEAQQNQIIPELGISQKELMEKINKNPKAMEKIQNSPELTKQLQENPKLLLDILDEKESNVINKKTINNYNSRSLSPLTQSYIQKNGNLTSLEKTKKPKDSNKNKTENSIEQQNSAAELDVATYIPSSDFVAKSELSQETLDELNSIQASSDKLLAKAEKLM